MAWTKHEPDPSINTRHAVYSETDGTGTSKTLNITDDLGAAYSLRVTFIEWEYIAAAVAGTRALEILVVRDGEIVYTLRVDDSLHPIISETKVIHFVPGASTVVDAISGATGRAIHTFHPNLVLAQGDVMTLRASGGGDSGDALDIFVHAEVLSGINKL